MTDSVKIHFEKKNKSPNKKTVEESAVSSEIQSQHDKIDEKIAAMPTEHGGRPKEKGLEPTRYGDWEFKGRCIDF